MVFPPPRYWYERLLSDLHQLATESEQMRLWFSTGRDGAETGSFGETVGGIFTECGLSVLIEKGDLARVASARFEQAILELEQMLHSVPKNLPALAQVNHPAMPGIRAQAARAHDALQDCMPQ